MANDEVTLLLGEQMAIVFLGVNVLFPLTLSAVLAFLVLLTVQTNRFLKRIMGRINSKNISNNMDDIQNSTETPVQTLQESTKENGNSVVRKRRSSIVNQSGDHHSPSRQTSPSPPSSQLSSIRSTSTDSVTRARKHRLGSGNRVSPIVTTPTEDKKKKQVETSWAWIDQDSQNKTQERKLNGKQTDRVLSPSQCHIRTISPDEPIKKGIMLENDMKAYDIW